MFIWLKILRSVVCSILFYKSNILKILLYIKIGRLWSEILGVGKYSVSDDRKNPADWLSSQNFLLILQLDVILC